MPLQIVYEDITQIKTDVLVNSTNHTLMGYSGVDKLIHSLGGDEFDLECEKYKGQLRYGEAIYTNGAGQLKCKYVIHTYAPSYENGFKGEYALLKSCYRESLKVAENLGCKTVAFPLIGAGSMGYPIEDALGIATSTIVDYINSTKSKLNVTLALYGVSDQCLNGFTIKGLDSYIDKKLSKEMCKASILMLDNECVFNERQLEERKSSKRTSQVNQRNEDKIKHNSSIPEFIQGESFQEVLCRLIAKRDIKDSEVYSPLGMPRQTFNNIINGKVKTPKRETIYGFAITLKLSIKETEELMQSAGLIFSNDLTDIIVKYCIEHKIYKLFDINAELVKYKQKPIFAE